MNTQASQLRLVQRNPDSGKWIVPDVRVEESSSDGQGVWADASAWFDTQGCSLSSVGKLVNFSYVAKRTKLTGGNIYRLVFTSREDTITTPQVVGSMAVVSTDIAGEVTDRTWAIYPLVGLPSGTLETMQPYDKLWPTMAVGDVVQFYGTWFI